MQSVASPRPAICQRIKDDRVAQRETFGNEHPDEANPYTQERVAQRIGVTLKTYRTWERDYEPPFGRLRQIAEALDLPPDHFLPAESTGSVTQLQATIAELQRTNDAILRQLAQHTKLIAELRDERKRVQQSAAARSRKNG